MSATHPRPSTPSDRADSAKALFVILGLLGTLVYAVWSTLGRFGEPTMSIIEWQATWGDGTYGIKGTILAVWLHIMLALGALYTAVWAPYDFVTRVRQAQPMPEGAEWQSLPVHGLRYAIVGTLVGFAPTAAFYSALLLDPESLSFLGQAALLAFVLGPLIAFWGAVSALNLVLPRRVVLGVVDKLRVDTDAKGNAVGYVAEIAKRHVRLSQRVWQQLRVGDQVALRLTALFDSPLALRVHKPVHYR